MGIINVTEPYIDANTGEMCYTISKPFTGADIEKCLFGHLPPSLCEYVHTKEAEKALFSPEGNLSFRNE